MRTRKEIEEDNADKIFRSSHVVNVKRLGLIVELLLDIRDK